MLGVEGGVAAGKTMTGPYAKAYHGLRNDPKNPESWVELAEALSESNAIAEKANQTLELVNAMVEAKGDPIKAARILLNKDVMPERVIKEGPAAEAEYMSGFAAGIAGDEAIEHGDAVKLGDVDVAGLRPNARSKSHRRADEKKGAPTGQTIPTLPSDMEAFPILLKAPDPDQKDGTGVYTSHKKHPLLGHQLHSHYETHRPQTHLHKMIPELHR